MSGEDGYLNSSPWFRHSCTPEGDPRFDAMRIEYGAEGYTVFFNALQYIYKGKCGRLEVKAISNKYGIPEERVNEILVYMEEECEGILHRNDEGLWVSDRAAEEMLKNKKAKEGKHLRNERYQEKRRQAEDSLKTDLSSSEDSLKSDYKNRKEKNREEYIEESKKLKFFTKEESGAVASNSTEKKASKFVSLSPPSLEEVREYGDTLQLPFDAESFYDHFTSNGWKVSGKAPMKDWKAAARNWARNGVKLGSPHGTSTRLTHPETKESDLVGVEWGEL